MLKLVGCVLLLGCGAAVQIKTVVTDKRELDTLSGLCAALRQMESDIRLDLTPMPRLLRRLSRSGPPNLRAFFLGLAQALEAGEDLPTAWGKGVPALGLGEEEGAALARLHLSGDEEAVRSALLLTERQLSAAWEDKRRKRAGKEKLSASLCFSAAAFLILLLI